MAVIRGSTVIHCYKARQTRVVRTLPGGGVGGGECSRDSVIGHFGFVKFNEFLIVTKTSLS